MRNIPVNQAQDFIKSVSEEAVQYLIQNNMDVSADNVTRYLVQYNYVPSPVITRSVILQAFWKLYRKNQCMKKRTIDELSIETGISERYIYSIINKYSRLFHRRKDINII